MNTWHLRYADESVGCDVIVSCGHSEREARRLAKQNNSHLTSVGGKPAHSPYPYYYATHGNDTGGVGRHVAELLGELEEVRHE